MSKAKSRLVRSPIIQNDWRIARTIFVADDEATARRYAIEDANGPYRAYYGQMLQKMIRAKRANVFKNDRDQPDNEITLDYVLENLVLYGTVNKVVDQILALREEVGDFGELVYAGMDDVDPALNKRSMILMAEQVMPRVNAAIGAAPMRASAWIRHALRDMTLIRQGAHKDAPLFWSTCKT